MQYRCEATSLGAFIQQLAVAYLANGYWFYVTGRIPERKDPAAVDRKLIERYGLSISSWARSRRKRSGLANMQYLRHERFFVLIATRGEHTFFTEEPFLDIRRRPICYGGYSVSYRHSTVTGRWHPSVRIERAEYNALKAYFQDLACRRSVGHLEELFHATPFEPYAPVRRQLLNILRAVNRERRRAGYDPVPSSCLRLSRRAVRVYAQRMVA